MTSLISLFIVSIVYNPSTLAQEQGGGIECIGIDSCKATNLKCRPGRPCEIICQGKSACSDSTISANGATSFHLICIGEDSCKSGLISCGTDICNVDCITYGIPNTNVCRNIFVHPNHATSFQCTGECPETVLAQIYTMNPSTNPTISPTSKTNNPSAAPTNMPSQSPIVNPTQFPTKSPTNNPITHPPTSIPTYIPSASPTSMPSFSPTNKPTFSPTNKPTFSPTYIPTFSPTNKPTFSPSNIPTFSPTNKPTFSPTNTPTTDEPTYLPTYMPSKSPTNTPTIEPTMEPTSEPTLEPTKSPTDNPSLSPTMEPTLEPTANPTNNPSKSPTNMPTKNPTSNPSQFPTTNPTETPTKYPTETPTKYPTDIPTNVPTNYPTNIPTDDPTVTPTVNPSTTPTIYPTYNPTILPSTNPTIQTTQTDTGGNCAARQNITSILSASKSTRNNRIGVEMDTLMSHGVLVTITLNHQLNINDATNIIDIVSDIMNELIHIAIPNDCLSSDPLEIKSIHSFVAMSMNFQIFVCNHQQQQQLLSVFDTNKNDILCQIVNSVQQQLTITIELNAATLKTDTIQIYYNQNINTTETINIISKNKNRNASKNTYYGSHGTRLQLILLFMVGTLAVTSILIACAIFILNKKKPNIYGNDDDEDSDEQKDKLTAIEMGKFRKQGSVQKKLSSTATGLETVESSSDESEYSEVNLHNANSNPVNFPNEVDVDIESTEYKHKCPCVCHHTEIVSTNDRVLREICGSEEYDDGFGSQSNTQTHSGCDGDSEQRQCCVIQRALWRAQMKRSLDGYIVNNEIKVQVENEAAGNDETPPTSSNTYELPKHAIV